jgi:hypothetical protein
MSERMSQEATIELLNRLSAAEARLKWEPIAFAPKDGNCILACAIGSDPMEPRIVYWYEWDQPHLDTGEAAHYAGWAVPDGNVYAPELFTHWMPLPAMPD